MKSANYFCSNHADRQADTQTGPITQPPPTIVGRSNNIK